MSDDARERIWWCALDRRAVDLDDINGPSCGPVLQCTGGRRRTLPCGWYRLVPDDLATIRYDLRRHLSAEHDPCQDRGVDWPCDVADALLPEERGKETGA